MTRSVEDGVATAGGLKVSTTDFDGLAFATFLRGGVEGPTEIPSLSSGFLGVVFVFLHGSFIDSAGDIEQVTAEGTLSGVYVTDEYDIQMFFYITEEIFEDSFIGNRLDFSCDSAGICF
jgi:hypothetical protein